MEKDSQRLEKQMAFLMKADKEKFITRQTYLTGGSRKENDAEHAWHIALMAMILEEYANEKIDLLHTIQMLLIHDLVEIYAGDTFAYDEEAKKSQRQREENAADRKEHIQEIANKAAQELNSSQAEGERTVTVSIRVVTGGGNSSKGEGGNAS